MKNKMLIIISVLAITAFTSCGKKSSKNEEKDSVKKDTVKKTQETKTIQKFGLNIPKGSYTYYGKQKDGYQLLAVEFDTQTFKRKSIYFKDVNDKDLQSCDIISDKNQGDNDILTVKTKETQKEVKITFPIMGDISVNGKRLVPATIFTSEDNRILTSSGGPVFLPFLLGENMNDLQELPGNAPKAGDRKKDDGVYIVFPTKYKGKSIEILVPSQSDKFDKIILTEDGKDIIFKNIES